MWFVDSVTIFKTIAKNAIAPVLAHITIWHGELDLDLLESV